MRNRLKSHFIANVVDSAFFHYLSLLFIVIACIIIGVETNKDFYTVHAWWLYPLDRIVIALFGVELVLRYLADVKTAPIEGIKKYFVFFTDGWHVIDAVVIIVCLLPSHIEYFVVLRTLRILRVFLLVDEIPRLKLLANALIKSVPSMGYIMLLLMLHFFAYSVIATDLFGASNAEKFGDITTSYISLFKVVTLDDWGNLMDTVIGKTPNIHPFIIVFYFISFVVIGAMIFMNLFIGVIINEITDIKIEEAAKHKVEQLEKRETIESVIVALEEQMEQISVTLSQLKAMNGANKTKK